MYWTFILTTLDKTLAVVIRRTGEKHVASSWMVLFNSVIVRAKALVKPTTKGLR
jgi:hypothetical protein